LRLENSACFGFRIYLGPNFGKGNTGETGKVVRMKLVDIFALFSYSYGAICLVLPMVVNAKLKIRTVEVIYVH